MSELHSAPARAGRRREEAARYQMYLPTEEELRAELAREREAAERALLAPDVHADDKGSESSR